MSKSTFLGPLIGNAAGRYELVKTACGSVLATHVEPAFDSKTRRRGLLGRDSVPDGYALIIAPSGSVHTFFMRCPIDLLFVSRDGTVVKTCRSVKPWRIAGALHAFAVIEAAAGFIDRAGIVPGEVVGLREIPERRRATDALPPVAGTSSDAASGPKPHRTDPSTPLTLADIVAHQTPLGWFESLAIVQELCATALALSPTEDPRVPELSHITLHPVGGVTLLAHGPADHSPVRRVCLVLLALTPEAQLPTELRLFVLGGLLPTPRLKSLKELHTELEFYERPNRLDIIHVVYERFKHLAAPAPVEVVKPPGKLEPQLPRERWQRPPKSWTRKWVWVGILVVVLALGSAAGIWQWQRPEGRPLRDRVGWLTQTASGMTHRAAEAARSYRAVVWRKLGLASAESTTAVPVAAEGGGEVTAPVKPSDAVLPAPQKEPQQAPSAAPLGPRQPAEQPAAVGAVAPQTVAATPGAVSSPPETPDVLPAPVATVYSAADPLVVPPELIRPLFPRSPPPGVRAEDLPEVEVLVSATGDVETVRLLSAGTGLRPTMMLSAIKTWVFQPATRDGQPVRYRYRLRLLR